MSLTSIMILLFFLLFAIAESASTDSNGNLPGGQAELPKSTSGQSEGSDVITTKVGEGSCQFFPEIAMVQDVSESFKDDLVQLKSVMPDLLAYFNKNFGGHAKFGITSFIDKPIGTLGGENDYCARVHMPLTLMNTDEAMQKAQEVWSSLESAGGNDIIEGGNEALFRASASDRVGWSTATHDKATGRPIVRLLVLSTDAPVHDPKTYDVAKDLPDHDLHLPENRVNLHKYINNRCGHTDYPSPAQIGAVMKERNITSIILAGEAAYEKGNGDLDHSDLFKAIWARYPSDSKTWEDPETGLVKYYEWYMKDQVGVEAVVHRIDSSSKTFIEVFGKAMDQVAELECVTKVGRKKAAATLLVAAAAPVAAAVIIQEAPAAPVPTGRLIAGSVAGGGLALALAAFLMKQCLAKPPEEADCSIVDDVDNVENPEEREQAVDVFDS